MEEKLKRLRMVCKFKRLNTECVKKTCKYEGISKIKAMSKRGLHTHALTRDVSIRSPWRFLIESNV